MSEQNDKDAATGEKQGDCTCRERKKDREPCYPPVSFTTFLLSLASSAMVHLGEAPEPETGSFSVNLPLAKHTIDILAMLDCKTRGNLSPEEESMLSNLLYELRLTYVKKGE